LADVIAALREREKERVRASAIGDKAGESAMRQATYYSGKKFKNKLVIFVAFLGGCWVKLRFHKFFKKTKILVH
jgi:hypothetical protein